MDILIMPVGTLGTNCYVLISKQNRCAIIDPGAQAEKIIAELAQRGLTPVYILLTHGHYDHIGAVKAIAQSCRDIKICIGKNDMEMLTDVKKSLAFLRQTQAEEFTIKPAQALCDGQELCLDELTIRVVETPGHTKGGVCYVCNNALFSGDTLFYGDVGRCDLYGGDYDTLLCSLKKLYLLEGDYIVYPGHGTTTKLEFERMNNRYIGEAMR